MSSRSFLRRRNHFFTSRTDAASLREHDSALLKRHFRLVSSGAFLDLEPVVRYLSPVERSPTRNEGRFDGRAPKPSGAADADLPVVIYRSGESGEKSQRFTSAQHGNLFQLLGYLKPIFCVFIRRGAWLTGHLAAYIAWKFVPVQVRTRMSRY